MHFAATAVADRAESRQTVHREESALIDESWSVPLLIDGPAVVSTPQPVTIGVPFHRGALTDSVSPVLFDPDDIPALLQSSVLARWSDGSVKWLLIDFVVPAHQRAGTWLLKPLGKPRPSDERSDRQPRLTITEVDQACIVDTGVAAFHVNRTSVLPISQVAVGLAPVLVEGSLLVALTDAHGRRHGPRVERFIVETRGPVRTTIRIEGAFAGAAPCRFVARCCFFAGTGLVRVRLTLHNPRPAKHPRGIWDLGDRGSIFFKSLEMEAALSDAQTPQITWSVRPDADIRSSHGPVEIYQDSSGGENWRSRNHVNRRGEIPCTFRGYRALADGETTDGLRANPWICVRSGSGCVTVVVPEFWQQFPKALEANGPTLRVGLFPRQWNDQFELQGGEQKTHTVWLHFGTPHSTVPALAWVHEPLTVRIAPQWYLDAGIMPYCTAFTKGPDDGVERLLQSAVHGQRSLESRREIIDEYGWRNYGDNYADHESALQADGVPLTSHYNNQYDLIHGCALQYMRTSDAAWFQLLDPLARHVIDIDIYHTACDRSAYSGGAFWHTDHYHDAATSTHRSFSQANARPGHPYGGGPSNEHNYTTGLLYYHYMTGDPQAREAVIGLANWVIRCDDGSRTLLGIIDDRPTGLASSTREPTFHGPGRGCGNSVNSLLDAWLVSGRPHYLEKAEALIRRTINPADDVPSLNLLDAERRWSYTVYLSALSRYLDLKAETGMLDSMYAYGQASLAHYAHWMLDNERPYLDHPERLEYPNEAWPAQDFRKANVLRLAARHTDPRSQSPLLERADEIASRAWRDLQKFGGIDSVRVLALLMVEGLRDLYFRASPPVPAAVAQPRAFAPPEVFVPQRHRIEKRLMSIRGLPAATMRAANPARWRKYFDAKQRNATEIRRARDGPVVCHVLHGLTVGGAEVLAARLARQLSGSFRFTFVCLDQLGSLGKELRAEGFVVHVLGRRPGVDLGCSRRLARFIREQNVDLLHCHLYSPFFYASCARLLFRRPPVLFTEHGRPHPDFPRHKRIVANRLLLERRDRIIGVGQAVRRALLANEGIPADRVSVIGNGINLAQLGACQGCRDEVRRELDLGPNDLVLLHVARLHPIKDHTTALRMLAQMLGRQPNSRLVIAGEGLQREIMQRQIAELGIVQQVRMLGVRSDVPRLLAAADIALLTSLNEGIPLTLIEAMAAGLPVVATNVGGVGEVVEDGVSGFLATAADPAALAGKALRLATDPELRSRMGQSGRARAHALFSESRMLAEYRRLYEEMLGD